MENQGLCHSLISYLSSHLSKASHLFWPGRCLVCQNNINPDDEGLCVDCWQNLSKSVASDYCRSCGREVSAFGIVNGRCGFCQDKHFHYDGIVRAGLYETTFRSLILAFKFSEKTELLARLAAMLKQTVTAGGFYDEIEMVVPVPLHWRRKLWRGYNQSYLLAKQIKLKDKAVSTDLVRIRNTQQQWDLTPPQRRRNVKGAFAVRKGHPFIGKTILLVDDISTSGATLNECAKMLKAAGAKKVYTAVLATAFHDD